MAFKSLQTLFIRNISLSYVFLHSVWSKFKMKCCVNTMTSLCGLWEIQSGAAKCTFHLLKQNKQYAKLHPKSLHIYSLRHFPDKLSGSSHVSWLRSHTKQREHSVRDRGTLLWQSSQTPLDLELVPHAALRLGAPGLVPSKTVFEKWSGCKCLFGKWPRKCSGYRDMRQGREELQ